MTTWYVGCGKCSSNLTQDLYEAAANPDMWVDCLEFDSDSTMVMSRVHGNPLFDTCDLGMQRSPACMRGQVNVYEAAFAVQDNTMKYKDQFDHMCKVWQKAEGLHIISVDDSMLVKQGEAHIHKQFTDYLADDLLKPEDEEKLWATVIRPYVHTQFMQQLNNGNVPAAIILEPVRQRLGLPYEWHGAPVED